MQVKRSLNFVIRTAIFNLLCLALLFGIVLYRVDFSFAQDSVEETSEAVLVPRESQIEVDDNDDDDEGDGDGDAEINIYVVQPGDNLWAIARQLGIDFDLLAAQTENPRRIFAGQVFTYSKVDIQTSGAVSVSASEGEVTTHTFTVRAGDTLSHIAMWLGLPLETLKERVDNPSRIQPGQTISYVSDRRIDTPPLLTDNDGTDSDGIDTTGQFTDNDGTDSDGIDTTGQLTDNDGTDSDGIDTTGQLTDNDGTDSDGINTTGQLTDNDGTDSDGIDTTGQFTDNDGTDSDGVDSDNDDSD